MMEIINYIISCVKYMLNILIFQHIFKYPEKWHNYPYNHKPYAMDIVNTINKKLEETYGIKIFDETKSIVEVGCGRGDIIGRLKKPCKEKLGLDLDSNILRMGGVLS